MKQCNKCKIEKPLEEFYKKAASKDGLDTQCEVCRKSHYNKNKDSILAKKAEYRANNRDAINASAAEYRAKNKDTIKARRAKYYAKNREAIIAKTTEYYTKNKDTILARYAEYRANNRNKRNEYLKSRYNNDPVFRMNDIFRKRLHNTVKGMTDNKMSKTKYYKHHLSSIIAMFDHPLAEEWIAGGEIQIDHLYPVAQLENPILGKYLESVGVEDTMDNRIMYVHSPANMRFMRAEENAAKSDSLNEWLSFVGFVSAELRDLLG